MLKVLTIRSMKIEATYFDDSYLYNSSHFMGYFEVSLIKTALELNIPSTDVKNPVDLICTVKDSYGKIVNMGTVTFKLKDENKVVNVVDGKAELNYTFKNTGINVVTISYNDGYYYDTSSKVVSLNVSKTNVELSLKFEENGGSYKIIVENENYPYILFEYPSIDYKKSKKLLHPYRYEFVKDFDNKSSLLSLEEVINLLCKKE